MSHLFDIQWGPSCCITAWGGVPRNCVDEISLHFLVSCGCSRPHLVPSISQRPPTPHVFSRGICSLSFNTWIFGVLLWMAFDSPINPLWNLHLFFGSAVDPATKKQVRLLPSELILHRGDAKWATTHSKSSSSKHPWKKRIEKKKLRVGLRLCRWEMMTFKMQMEVSSGLRVPFILCYPDAYTGFWSNLNSCVPDSLGWHMSEGDTFTTKVDFSVHQISQVWLTARPAYEALGFEPRALHLLEKSNSPTEPHLQPLEGPLLRILGLHTLVTPWGLTPHCPPSTEGLTH